MMTREEAIEIFEQKGWWIAQKETFTSKQAEEIIKLNDAVNFALSALRPFSREQVEKVWRGEWLHDPETGYEHCDKCLHTISLDDYLNRKPPLFCEMCGAPMTDEAVQMVMERMEELKDAGG